MFQHHLCSGLFDLAGELFNLLSGFWLPWSPSSWCHCLFYQKKKSFYYSPLSIFNLSLHNILRKFHQINVRTYHLCIIYWTISLLMMIDFVSRVFLVRKSNDSRKILGNIILYIVYFFLEERFLGMGSFSRRIWTFKIDGTRLFSSKPITWEKSFTNDRIAPHILVSNWF